METSTDMLSMEALKQFTGTYPMGTFRTLAYYNKPLDCIRMQAKDCSFTEVRVNRIFTLWYENHSGEKNIVGVTIKGVKHLFVTLGILDTGHVYVAMLLDKILQHYPEQTIKETIDEIKKRFKGYRDLLIDELPDRAFSLNQCLKHAL